MKIQSHLIIVFAVAVILLSIASFIDMTIHTLNFPTYALQSAIESTIERDGITAVLTLKKELTPLFTNWITQL